MTLSPLRGLLAVAVAIFLASTSPALAQARSETKDVSISHGGDFFRDRTEVPGSVENRSRTTTYPCINVLFMFQRGREWEPELMKITGLRPGEVRRYNFRSRPADAVLARGAFPCADPVTAEAGDRCTVVGALIEPPRGFRQRFALDAIVLRDARSLDVVGRPARRTLDHRKHLMFYTFSDVPVGRELHVWLSPGWAFGGRETVRVRCDRGGQKLDLGRRRVQIAADD